MLVVGFFSISEIRKSMGFKVTSFSELATLVAELGYKNHHYNLLFRGQVKDYKDKNKKSKIYPSLYRPPRTRLTIRVIKAIREKVIEYNPRPSASK